ncbi:hypothetical protein SRABI106_02499 [Rahnella aquatilis]|nr:hypothetical protein SRABI106_02499 [Rahnella aquatilis]
MRQVVNITRDRSKTIVDGMRPRQTGIFKAQTGQQCVGFHHGFNRWRHQFLLNCGVSTVAVSQQRFFAGFGNGHPGDSRVAAYHRLGMGTQYRLRFNKGRQAVSDTGGEQAYRCLCANMGIHQHQIRVFIVETVGFENAFIGVDNRQRTARRIGRGHGRHNHYVLFQFICNGFNRVERLTATEPNHYLCSRITGDTCQTGDFAGRGFTVKALVVEFYARFFQ